MPKNLTILGRLAEGIQRGPRRALALTAVFFVVGVVFGAPVVGELKSADDFLDPDSETVAARDTIERASGAQTGIAVVALVRRGPVEGSRTRATVERVTSVLRADRAAVAQVLSFYSTRDPRFVSRDGNATFVAAVFKPIGDERTDEAATRLKERLEPLPGVSVGGPALVGSTIGETVGEDLAKAELIAFPILFIASLFVFRGVIAALLPLYVGVITIFGTFLCLRLVSQFTSLSVFSLNLVVALGLGLAIDYSLFVLSRYREELARGSPTREALVRTLQTAGRTVLFSGLTVAAALAALLVFPQRFLYSMGIGGVVCTSVAVLASLVALPALLVALGPRVNALSIGRWRRAAERSARAETSGFWYRLSRAVMRRPAVVAVVTATVLIVAGLPFLRIEFIGADAGVLPKTSPVRQIDETLQAEFPGRRSESITVAVKAPAGAERDVEAVASGLRQLPSVAEADAPRRLGGEVWQIEVFSRHPTLDDRTLELVREIRDHETPVAVSVTGAAAEFVDQQKALGSRLPVALLLLCVVTLVVLFAMTGSVVLPLKSLLMNALSLSAAFGLLVLIFQDGRLEGVLNFESQGALNATQPIVLFAVAFGLSTDYAVFLLTRIKEARSPDGSETEAVALGLQRTGRIVTAAALLFSIAIGAFATSEVVFIKQVGVGTALAVLIDATIVRALLVPSLMALLGARNWWAPRPLRRLHGRLGLSEA